MQYFPLTYIGTLDKFELFGARLTDPIAQNLKTLYFDISPDLDLTRDLNLTMLNMD